MASFLGLPTNSAQHTHPIRTIELRTYLTSRKCARDHALQSFTHAHKSNGPGLMKDFVCILALLTHIQYTYSGVLGVKLHTVGLCSGGVEPGEGLAVSSDSLAIPRDLTGFSTILFLLRWRKSEAELVFSALVSSGSPFSFSIRLSARSLANMALPAPPSTPFFTPPSSSFAPSSVTTLGVDFLAATACDTISALEVVDVLEF